MDNNHPANPIGAEVMREALKQAWLEGAADRMAAHGNGEGWDVDRRWAESAAASVWNHRLSHSTPGDAEGLDWLKIARLAGEYGIRYRTNRALEQFLAAIVITSQEQALRGALERIAAIPTREWSIDTAKCIARQALATPSGRAQAWLPVDIPAPMADVPEIEADIEETRP